MRTVRAAGPPLLLATWVVGAGWAAVAGTAPRPLGRATAVQKLSREAELAAIRRQIADLEGRLALARRRQTGIAGDLEAADL
ncbi:MAG: hypothetical protein M3O15_12795, partial [Acidobacteriota bacterium]|nr:hypothetical protein [Acidobacteriota bacterium]